VIGSTKSSTTVTRALALKDGKDVHLVSHNKKAFDYPQLLDVLRKLPAEHLILDGEIAALDEKDHSSFQCSRYSKAPVMSHWSI
jgi:ATP-dependent DNA ligase